MLGDRIRSELRRPLEGDRSFVRLESGQFVLRIHPEHIARVRTEKARLRVEEDIRNFRRTLNRRMNQLVLS